LRKIESARQVSLSWPHLETPVHAPVRAMLAERLFLASVRDLRLQVVMPDGEIFGAGRGRFASGGDPALRISDPAVFFSRIGRDGSLGFGESYLLRAWGTGEGARPTFEDSRELVAWLRVYATSLRGKESGLVLPRLRDLWLRSLPASEENSVGGARRNVQAHYDLDPQLFELFLDPLMVYSSGSFDATDDLEAAQLRKLDAILDLAHVGAGTRLLDIGSGFGALAMRAARERGANVTGITLSEKQLEYAAGWAGRLGLDKKITFLLEDYREHAGKYDAITSVEMIEAVGAAYWTDFFEAVDRLLAPEGCFGLQVITFPHQKMLAARRDFSWVDRYIFPGGTLPSLREINRIVGARTALEIVAAHRLSDSYARTLRQWRKNFLNAASDVISLGFDETFIRLWNLYFSYFEAGFLARYCDVWQLGFRKRPRSGG
jgi:cyclopropane-fatty-acyl-phospholipid synthase